MELTLIDEGFASVDDIADADAASLETVEEFDTTMVEELQERASDAQLVPARSPFNSFDTACTREPRIPIQEPIGSIRLSFACYTFILFNRVSYSLVIPWLPWLLLA
jgi:uncharacterized membrane protein